MAIFRNINRQLTQTKIRQIAKIPPNSSAIAEKIKSCFTSGILYGIPWFSPMPNHPPVPMANRELDTWFPSRSNTARGSCHATTRTRTWLNKK
jgi:hypothetical protein